MDPINRPGIGSVGVIGASPNSSGASITGNVFTLQPASASFGGVLTSGTQTIAGAKTFTDAQTIANSLTLDTSGSGLFWLKSDDTSQAEFKFANRSGFGISIYRAPSSTDMQFYSSSVGSNCMALTNSAIGAGSLSVFYTTASTSTTTGALVVTGGIGCGGRITVDGASTKTLKYVNGVANAAVAVLFGAVGPTGSTAGTPLGWVRIDVAGTDRYQPYW